jgi:glycerate kinase
LLNLLNTTLIAPDKFKGSLSAAQAAGALARVYGPQKGLRDEAQAAQPGTIKIG